MPIDKDGKRYARVVSGCVPDSTPVAWFVATSLALGIAAPVASVIAPFSDAVDCASAALPKPVKSTTNKEKRKNTFQTNDDLFSSTAIILFLRVEILSQAVMRFRKPISGRRTWTKP